MPKLYLTLWLVLAAAIFPVFAGPSAPHFKAEDLEANLLDSDVYKGKPIILFFWTTHCPFCRGGLRQLDQLHEGLRNDGIEVLLVNIGERSFRVSNFVKNFSLRPKVILDPYGEIADSFDVFGVPTYILIDRNYKIVFRDINFPADYYRELLLKPDGRETTTSF